MGVWWDEGTLGVLWDEGTHWGCGGGGDTGGVVFPSSSRHLLQLWPVCVIIASRGPSLRPTGYH